MLVRLLHDHMDSHTNGLFGDFAMKCILDVGTDCTIKGTKDNRHFLTRCCRDGLSIVQHIYRLRHCRDLEVRNVLRIVALGGCVFEVRRFWRVEATKVSRIVSLGSSIYRSLRVSETSGVPDSNGLKAPGGSA